MMIDFDEIEEKTREYKEKIRQDRLNRGLPEKTPEDFVPIPLSVVLVERLKPFEKIVIRYAKLLMDSGELIPIDTKKLDKYRRIGELLSMSKGLFSSVTGAMVIDILRYMDKVNQALLQHVPTIDPDHVATHLYLSLQLFGSDSFYDSGRDDYRELERAYRNEYNRLKTDPIRFIMETKRYRRQYESIKHLI
ncbi:hypothetical protein WD019_15510 [Fictibacillus sp. Mic-4]|uniref:hypothetical protein n=1 Tax=Fictibacillus sp. Mic-4 TaxID=3132826 RepID=UPI003CF765AC